MSIKSYLKAKNGIQVWFRLHSLLFLPLLLNKANFRHYYSSKFVREPDEISIIFGSSF